MRKTVVIAACMGVAIGFASGLALSQQDKSTIEEIERYRQALADGNPADLWEMRGEGIWKQKRGPKNASLEKCDLGLGPGVVKGVYTVLPKYFADSDKVEDLESRLVTCMVTLQGLTPAEARKDPFGALARRWRWTRSWHTSRLNRAVCP